MRSVNEVRIFVFCLAALSAPASTQTIVAVPVEIHTTSVDGFIVTEGDISDRPYQVIGPVHASVGQLSTLSKSATPDKADVELRKRAKKMGADAVVRVKYVRTGPRFGSWGNIVADGQAIRFMAAAR